MQKGGKRAPQAWLPPRREDDESSHLHRLAIGLLGITMPFTVVGLDAWRPTPALHDHWRPPLDSISAYYYSGATPAFTGPLIALAVFLLTYRGYRNPKQHRDLRCAMVAGIAALGVALFPTTPPVAEVEPLWWADWMTVVHHLSAGVLFLSFFVFAYFLFPDGSTSWRKPIYKLCGMMILLGMAGVVGCWLTELPIFWAESWTLIWFALSWLLKGHATQVAGEAFLRTGDTAKQLFASLAALAHRR